MAPPRSLLVSAPALGVAVVALGSACTPGTGEDPTPDPDAVDPCASVWGEAPGTGRVIVEVGAEQGGDGSTDAPFGDLGSALEAARAGAARQIALGIGEHQGPILLAEAFGDGGLEIVGCGRGTTSILGAPALPTVDIAGPGADGVTVRDLAVVGGRRAVLVRDAAGTPDPVLLERLDVRDAVRIGVMVDGPNTLATLQDVLVDGVSPEDGAYGWGVAVQQRRPAADLLDQEIGLHQVEVRGAAGTGVLIDGALVVVTDLTVSDTAPSQHGPGRGIQVQRWSVSTLTGVVASGNTDASIFLECPGRLDPTDPTGPALPVAIYDSVLGPTLSRALPSGLGESADGIAATQADPSGRMQPAMMRVEVDGNEFIGNARAHLVAEAVTLSLGPNNVFGKGTTFPLAAQDEAEVEGIDGEPVPDEMRILAPEEAMDLDRIPLVSDIVTE